MTLDRPDPIPARLAALAPAVKLALDSICPATRANLNDLAVAPADVCRAAWHYALRGGVAPSLAERVLLAPANVLDAWSALVPDMRATRRDAEVAWLRRRHCMARTLRLLNAAEIRCVPIKGMALAEPYYSVPHARLMADIDLAVGAQVDRAVAVLGSANYEPYFADPEIQAADRDDTEIVLRAPGHSAQVIDLHHRLYADQPAAAVDELLARARSGVCCGVAAYLPEHHDLLIVVVHHLSGNLGCGPAALRWWLDVHLLASHESTDWTIVLERADAWGDALPLCIALCGAVQQFGTLVPEAFWPQAWSRLMRRERRLLRRAVVLGAETVHADEVRAALWRERKLGWRSRSVWHFLWPSPGKVARELGLPAVPTKGRTLFMRLRYLLRQLRRLAGVLLPRLVGPQTRRPR